jgi:hypothetical protein
MTKELTLRYKRCLAIATTMKFTEDEINLLKNMISEILAQEKYLEFEDWDRYYEIDSALYDLTKAGHCTETFNEDETLGAGVTSSTEYVPLTFTQFLLVNFRRIFLFIASVPLDRVPLYLNDPRLEPFAKWRLTIAK